MLANQPARILARRARFLSETRRESRQMHRQILAVQDFSREIIRERHLGRRRHVHFLALDLVHILREFRQLPRPRHRRPVDDIRRNHLREIILHRVHIQHQIVNGTLQPRRRAQIEIETRARDLPRTLRIQNPQRFAQLIMRLDREIKLRRLAPATHLRILTVIRPKRHRRITQIRNLQQKRRQLRFNLFQFPVNRVNLIADRLHRSNRRRRILTGLLRRRNLLRFRVSLRLQRLRLHQERAPLLIEREHLVQIKRTPPILQIFLHHVRMLADKFHVQHRISSLQKHPGNKKRPQERDENFSRYHPNCQKADSTH